MAKKYTLSVEYLIAPDVKETMTIEGCDSLDEAVRVIEKGEWRNRVWAPKVDVGTAYPGTANTTNPVNEPPVMYNDGNGDQIPPADINTSSVDE